MATSSNNSKPDFLSAYNKYMSKIRDAHDDFTKMYSVSDILAYIYGKQIKPDQKTNFEKVSEFNTTAAVERINEKTEEVFDTHPKMIDTCLSLIREEVSELEEAVKAHNLTETRDALADILYVVYGMAFRLSINADADFNLVHESNMSKFCVTEEEAILTVDNYKALHEQGKSPYPSPAYRYEKETEKWVVYEQTTGKILKNIIYKPVDLSK